MKAFFDALGRGPIELQPGKTGQFDIAIGGKLAYSRHETGLFPSEADLKKL